jgi:rod shape-determining protein MreD
VIYTFLVVVAFLGLVVQNTLFTGYFLQYFRPDCVLGVTLFSGFHLSRFPGLLLSFSLGYVADVLSGTPDGWNAFFMTLVFFLTHGLGSQIFLKGIWTRMVTVILFATLKGPCSLMVLKAAGYHVSLSLTLLFHWLGEALATVLFTLLLFYVMYHIQRMDLSFSVGREKHPHP